MSKKSETYLMKFKFVFLIVLCQMENFPIYRAERTFPHKYIKKINRKYYIVDLEIHYAEKARTIKICKYIVNKIVLDPVE